MSNNVVTLCIPQRYKKYEEYRKHWFDNLPDEITIERSSLYALDIDFELERFCRCDWLYYLKSHDDKPRFYTIEDINKL